MTRWELYVTWILLAYLAVAVRRLLKDVELAREEIEEFRQYMVGENTPSLE